MTNLEKVDQQIERHKATIAKLRRKAARWQDEAERAKENAGRYKAALEQLADEHGPPLSNTADAHRHRWQDMRKVACGALADEQ